VRPWPSGGGRRYRAGEAAEASTTSRLPVQEVGRNDKKTLRRRDHQNLDECDETELHIALLRHGDDRIIPRSFPHEVPGCAWPDRLNRSGLEADQTVSAGCADGGVDQAPAPLPTQPRGKVLSFEIAQLRIWIQRRVSGLVGQVIELSDEISEQFDIAGAVVKRARKTKLARSMPCDFRDQHHGFPGAIPGAALFGIEAIVSIGVVTGV
jgi:hypothetical protein